MVNDRFKKIFRPILIDWAPATALFVIVLAVLGVYLGQGIKMKLSLTDLLPDDHPSVIKFKKLTDSVGGVGYLTALLRAEDGKSHLESIPRLIEQLEKNPLVKSAFIKREEKFFMDRILYYVPMKDLETLEKNIGEQITQSKRNMFDIGLWDEEPKAKEEKSAIDPKLKEMAVRSAHLSPLLISQDGKTLLLMIKPSFDSMDLERTTQLVDFADKTLKETLPKNVTYEFAERYYSKVVESRILEQDIYILGLVSMAIMALVLWLYFRSWRAVIVVFIPVFLGLGITAGITRLFIGHINIITGFLVGILSGVGTDYGIHMYWRLRLEQKEPSSADPSPIWRTMATSGVANFVTVLSACAAFFLLCFSSFKVFSEFGFICGAGLGAILFGLLLSFTSVSKVLRLESHVNNSTHAFGKMKLPLLNSPRAFWVGLGVTLVLIAAASQVQFEYDFDKMMQHAPRINELNKMVDEIYERSTVPSAFEAPTKQIALDIENLLKDKYMPHTVQSIISGATIIPEQQPEKAVILARLKEKLRPIKDKWIETSLNVPASSVRTWLEAKPFTLEDLPIHVQVAMRGTKQSSYLLYLYPAYKLDNAPAVNAYASMIKGIESQYPSILTGSDVVIFSDILDVIKHDGIILLTLMILAIGGFIWMNLGSLRDTLLCYVPFLAALPVGVGLMALFQVKFNIFNMAILPAFIAVGVEVPIHIMQRTREIGSGFKAVRDIAVSLHLALFTTAVGFGILIFTRAGVLKSLGWIALMATAAVWWVGMFVLPAFLERFYKKRGERGASFVATPAHSNVQA